MERAREPIEIDERWPVLGSILETGRGAVLVVDDEPRPRERLVIRLLRAGFRVAAARPAGVFDALCELEEAGEAEPFVVLRLREERTLLRLQRGPLRGIPAERTVVVLEGAPGTPVRIRGEGGSAPLEQVVLAAIEERQPARTRRPAPTPETRGRQDGR